MSSPNRARQLNRAEVVDQRFLESLESCEFGARAMPDGGLEDTDLLELFESQMTSRQLDLMARVKR
ncbi:MAG: hypothetical protein ACPGJE_06145, partial [Wenzhouxiangellaceae bacterium]